MNISDFIILNFSKQKCQLCHKRKAEVIRSGANIFTKIYVCKTCAKIVKW